MSFFKNTNSGSFSYEGFALEATDNNGEVFINGWRTLLRLEIDKIPNFNGHYDISDGSRTELYKGFHQDGVLEIIANRAVAENNYKLISLTMPNTIKEIGEEAFEECTSLKSITLSNAIESIGERAFASCTSLEELILPPTVTHIGDKAFAYCTSLRRITVPKCFRGDLYRTGLIVDTEVTFI